jgi:CRISPR-associated protein Cas4
MQFRPYNTSTWISFNVGRLIGHLFRRKSQSSIAQPSISVQPRAVPPVPNQFGRSERPFINAHEISDFIYCERSWWLSKHNYFGQLSPQLAAAAAARFAPGAACHEAYSRNAQSVSSQRRSLRRLMIAFTVFLALALVVLVLLAQAHASSPKHKSHSPAHSSNAPSNNAPARIPPKVALSKLAPFLFILFNLFAFFILLIYLLRRKARRRQKRWQMPQGNLVYVDDKKSNVLICHDLGLAGKPDAIWRDGTHYVPEERKTRELEARRGPFDNHVLQLVAYCYLVAKNYGPVQQGLISYLNVQHPVPYTQERYERLVATLNRMRFLAEATEVHRSHQSVAKCRGCVASSICGQTLF